MGSNADMGHWWRWFRARVNPCVIGLAMTGALIVQAQERDRVPQPAKAEQLFAMANETRARAGRGRLEWDSALAEAAMKHCMRMAAEGPISHRYGGEPDLTERAGSAGAHFSLIEENIAVGSYPGKIHQAWLDSPAHRENLLNPEIDRVGIAVVAAKGVLFAVADYARAVPVLVPTQVESTVATQLRAKGVAVRRDAADARAACHLDHGLPSLTGTDSPQFVMRWQGPDVDRLPSDLVERLASGRYRQAAVGSCPARNAEGSFTVYRVAVLLY
jgi:hypothetical protein